ncbi:hypothetical protein ACS0TY_015092 [Phlomoides rotata]
MDLASLKTLVESKWNSWDIRGWGGFVLKEKLKKMKKESKAWKELLFGKIDLSIKKYEEIHNLDLFDDVFGLEEDEAARRSALMQDLSMDLKWKDDIIFQKSRAKWLAEGNCNSKLFHYFINKRNKNNEINDLWINDKWIDSVSA